MRNHLFIPDNQVKPDVDTSYGDWIGKLILTRRPEVIVFAGDLWDFPSLNSYDSKLDMECRRLYQDIIAGNDLLQRILRPAKKLQAQQRHNRKTVYKPEIHFTIGNHENRLQRFINDNPVLEGILHFDLLKFKENNIKVHKYLEIVTIDGVNYSHFFPRNARGGVTQQKNGSPNARTQGIRYHESCTAGHAQGLDFDCSQTKADGTRIYSLIAGSCYLHDESYKTPQGNGDWRGVVFKNNVQNGTYDPEFISLNLLKLRYGEKDG